MEGVRSNNNNSNNRNSNIEVEDPPRTSPTYCCTIASCKKGVDFHVKTSLVCFLLISVFFYLREDLDVRYVLRLAKATTAGDAQPLTGGAFGSPMSTFRLMTNSTVPMDKLMLEERDLKEDLKRGLWGVQIQDFENCSVPWDNPFNIEWMQTLAWRTDNYCNVSHPEISAWMEEDELHLACLSSTKAKAFRKGFQPFLYPFTRSSSRINDSEIISTYCDFNDRRLLVRHLENATVKATQEKIYSKSKVMFPDRKPHINVLMVDGVSRAQFVRGLKQTTALLEWIHQNSDTVGFQVFQFMRYTVLGRNSIYNLTPLVSGRLLEDKDAKGHAEEFNHKSWLWEHANANGYVTMWADEQCPFPNHVTPWAAPSFAGGGDRVASVHHRFGDIYCSLMNAQYGSDKRCLYGKQAHQYTFDYLDSFFSHYRQSPKFAWSILYEAHEPSLSILPLLDNDLFVFMNKSLEDRNRITVLVSDHGMHYGPYLNPPYPGRLEHTFPSLFLVVPNDFLKLHPKVEPALRELEQALITAVDIYSILLHLIHWPNPPTGDLPPSIKNLLIPGSLKPNRSCKEANIPPEYCYCNTNFWARTKIKIPKIHKPPQPPQSPQSSQSPQSPVE